MSVAKIAPALAAVDLTFGEYLLTSHFGLLSGAVADGMGPTTAWGLNTLGWSPVSLPFAVFVAGYLVADRQNRQGLLTATHAAQTPCRHST